MIDRRQVLESILMDPTATAADRMRALDALDRLSPDDDPRDFKWAEIADELGEEGIDLLLGTPVLGIEETARRMAREILEDDEAFNREVHRVAERLTAEARAQIAASLPEVVPAAPVAERRPGKRPSLRAVPVPAEVLERGWPSSTPPEPPIGLHGRR
jgi:hypothetical protein